MKFEKLIRSLAPVVALAFAAGISGCKDMNIRINDEEGVPLAELDMSGDPPSELVLAGPDTVVVTDGTRLDIDVEGDAAAVEALRFTLSEGTLGILREGKSWSRGDGIATVRVTMPSPAKVVIAGSGGVAAQSMARQADVTIAGSGRLDVASISADQLDVNVMGSGTFGAAGTATALDLNIAGSGNVEAKGLRVDRASLNIMGSGDAEFASDGTVEAKIMGSGNVTVTGNATCTVKAMGSGTMTCRNAGASSAAAPEAPTPPAAPNAPEAPEAPEPRG
jgi:hypothetical protein